ncbi:hypothetical protein [Haloarchaeobius baliensis]|uniref:hypothetical protein n=1 Tax=Haloarchaeobius baliensis TaxID=1670458 RepID=UPI003F883DFF
MKRTLTVALALLLVLAPVVALGHVDTGGASASPASPQDPTANVSPGSQLASVVSAGQAEVDAAYEQRRLAVRLAQADDDPSRAAILAETRDSLVDRLAELQDDVDEIDDDEVDDGEYTARLAGIVANARAVQQEARRAGALANRLPNDLRSEYGIGNGTFAGIREQAAALVDADTEAYVTGVVGEDVGEEFEDEADDDEDGEADGNETDGDGGDSDGTDGDGTEGDGTDGDGDGGTTTDDGSDGDGRTTTDGDGSDGSDSDDGGSDAAVRRLR